MYSESLWGQSLCLQNRYVQKISFFGSGVFVVSFASGLASLVALTFCPNQYSCSDIDFPERYPPEGRIEYCYNTNLTNSSFLSDQSPPVVSPCSTLASIQKTSFVFLIATLATMPFLTVFFCISPDDLLARRTNTLYDYGAIGEGLL